MWGLMVQIQGARVDASVPDWLLNASATFAAIDQVRRAANEMAASPDAYGFDPAATYTILVQTWDRALANIRSAAFGRDASGQAYVGLIPDPYYVASRGFSAVRRAAMDLPRWAARSDVVAWRGSVTGPGSISRSSDLPRIQLALACRDRPGFDVGLIGVHTTMAHVLPPGEIEAFVVSERLLRDFWPVADFGRHKFAIDIDGHANAWGLLEKLILGCCVLKVSSPYEQWFYDRLKPWRHFVPIKADLSDLVEIVDWCRTNEAQCRLIADNGARLATALTLERDLPQTCAVLMTAAYAQPPCSPARADRHGDLAALPLLLRDQVHRAKSVGDLDQAIAGYARLIDIGSGGAEALMRRHNLLRQRGDFVEAQSALERAVAEEPGDDEAPLRLGQFLALVGRDIAAMLYFERALSAAPERAEVRIALAGSCLTLGWLDRAFWAVRRTPEDLPYWWPQLRGRVLGDHATRRAEVFALFAARRARGSLTPEQTLKLTAGLASLGRLNLAWRLCADAMANTTGAAAFVEIACDVITRRRGPAEAERFLAEASVHASGDDAHLLRRASFQFELGDYTGALDILSSDGRLQRVEPPAWRIAAFCLTFLRRKPAFRAHCRAWMTRFPSDMLPAELICAAQPCPVIAAPDLKVPRADLVLGQFWQDEAIPDDVRAIMNSWTDHHPGLRHHVYSTESARAFLLESHDGDTIRAFDAVEDVAAKAAFFRLAWLHRSGGVWTDVDQRCIRSVRDELEWAAAAEITAVRSGYITGYLGSGFLGARAGSSAMELALRRATDTILEATRRGEPVWTWGALGSGLLTRVAGRLICESDEDGEVRLLTPFQYQSFAITTRTLAYKTARGGRGR